MGIDEKHPFPIEVFGGGQQYCGDDDVDAHSEHILGVNEAHEEHKLLQFTVGVSFIAGADTRSNDL